MTDQTPKFCPHCGTPLTTTAKFCPKCGYAVGTATPPVTPTPAAAQPTPPATPQPSESATGQYAPLSRESLASVRAFSGNYFQWWLATIRHPATPVANASQWFGALTLALESLLMTLTLTTLVNKGISLIQNYSHTDMGLGGTVSKFGFICFILLILGYLIYVSIGYGFHRLIDTEATISFLEYTNQFAGVTNLILAFNLITFLISLLTGNANPASLELLIFFLTPAGAILNLGYLFSIVNGVKKPRLDKFYTILLAEVAISIALLVFAMIAGGLIGSTMIDSLKEAFFRLNGNLF